MNMNIIYFLFGGCKICAKSTDAEKILNICMHYRFVYRKMMRTDDCLSFECSMYTADMLCEACRKYNVELAVDRKFGLPNILMRYQKRLGVLAGLILAMTLIIYSEQYVWDIRITGCECIEENSVISELCDQKFRLGVFIPNTDIDVIENRVLIHSDNIAWISINMKGSVAYVEIREKVREPKKESRNPANLVASWDGQIESIEAEEGNLMVKVGQHVRRGDLLVSGVYDSNAWGYRYTRAKGCIYARTVHEIHVEIPLYYEEKCYNGEEYSETTVFFFSKAIKLYRNTGFLVGTYDTICNEENICLFDGTRLPISYKTTTYKWYTCNTNKRENNEAMSLAYDELNRKLAEYTSQGAEILKKNISWSLTDEAYILDCSVTLIENIAGTVEFEVSE